MHTQTLPQSGLLHLLSHEVVPAIAALPYQPDLMAQDRQVAHEADRRHGPGKEEARGLALSRPEKSRRPLASGTQELSTEEEGASLNDKVMWNQAMPTERLKVIICRSRGFSCKPSKKFRVRVPCSILREATPVLRGTAQAEARQVLI